MDYSCCRAARSIACRGIFWKLQELNWPGVGITRLQQKIRLAATQAIDLVDGTALSLVARRAGYPIGGTILRLAERRASHPIDGTVQRLVERRAGGSLTKDTVSLPVGRILRPVTFKA